MKPISQFKFYDLGAKLHRVVANKSAVGAAEMFVPLMEAQTALDTLIKGDPIQLETAKAEANTLLNKLGAMFDKHFIDLNTRQFRFPGREDVIDGHELTLLRSLVEKFETALASELSRKAVFIVPKRGLYDTYELVEHADKQFSDSILNGMPTMVREDIRAAGRALAFGLGTACCFHLVRAIEALLNDYNQGFGGGSTTQPDILWREGLPRLIALSKSKNANTPDPRILSMLGDIDTRIRPSLLNANGDISIADASIFFNTSGSLISLLITGTQHSGKNQQRIKNVEEKLDETHRAITTDEEDGDEHAQSARSKSA